MKKCILFLLFVVSFKINSQVFTYSASSATMTGVTGDTFWWNVTFTNPSASSVIVEFDRYTKYNPAYWYSCFCYTTCNPPSLDYLPIHLAPNSSTLLVVLFKTDSVNPGTATASIRIYEKGFPNAADTVHLNVSTSIATGVLSGEIYNLPSSYPNPVEDKFILNGSLKEPFSVFLTNHNGKILNQFFVNDNKELVLSFNNYQRGEYFLKIVYQSGKTETKKIIKQ